MKIFLNCICLPDELWYTTIVGVTTGSLVDQQDVSIEPRTGGNDAMEPASVHLVSNAGRSSRPNHLGMCFGKKALLLDVFTTRRCARCSAKIPSISLASHPIASHMHMC